MIRNSPYRNMSLIEINKLLPKDSKLKIIKYIDSKNCLVKCSCGKQYNHKDGISRLIHRRPKMCYDCGRKHVKKSDMRILLEDSGISYYITGVILADGAVNSEQIAIGLQAKDKKWIDKIASYLCCNVHQHTRKKPACDIIPKEIIENTVRIAFGDKKLLPKFIKKFGITVPKTYNEINISKYKHIDDEMLICLLIGIIDGDGCIRKNKHCKSILISQHISQNKFHQYLSKRLNKIISIVSNIRHYKGSKNPMSYMFINKSSSIKLMNYISKYNLPVLERKWKNLEVK